MSDVVTVYRSRNPLEIQMIQSALEGAGLSCHVEGDHQAGYSGIFEIELVVASRDEAFARELLAEFRPQERLEPADESPEAGEAVGDDGD